VHNYFSLSEICEKIKSKNYKVIELQIPNGLKIYAEKLSDELQKECNCEVIISGEPCYGACDISYDTSAECIVHIAHTSINIKQKIPIYFVDFKITLDATQLLKKIISTIDAKNIGLLYIAQYRHYLPLFKRALSKKFKIYIGKASKRTVYDGQVLGCDYHSATTISKYVTDFLLLTDGDFHAIGVKLAAGKNVHACDMLKNEIRSVEEAANSLLKKRYAKIVSARNAKKIHIIISRKLGQRKVALAKKLYKKLSDNGKKCYILSIDNVKKEYLENFNAECFVNTSCPRVTLDDLSDFNIPVLTPPEVELMLCLSKKYTLYTL